MSIDYDKVMGDMTSSAGQEGGDQKAVQLATAASSVLNAKAGKEGDDASAEQERAAVSMMTSLGLTKCVLGWHILSLSVAYRIKIQQTSPIFF